MTKLKDNEYECAACGGIFGLVRDENWSNEKAEEEYKEKFPSSSTKNRDIVCDDCWQLIKPKGYFCGKCNQHFNPPYYCIHKYSPEAPKL